MSCPLPLLCPYQTKIKQVIINPVQLNSTGKTLTSALVSVAYITRDLGTIVSCPYKDLYFTQFKIAIVLWEAG